MIVIGEKINGAIPSTAGALSAGMDSAILDPASKTMMETLYAAEVLPGMDKFCGRHNRAYRLGKTGVRKQSG